jgi:hypothetical protein
LEHAHQGLAYSYISMRLRATACLWPNKKAAG